MRRSTKLASDLDKATGYLPGVTAGTDSNEETSPYTRPYAGTNAVLERDGYVPASMSGRSYPGCTPYNTPEPDSGLPIKLNRNIGNLTNEEITMRITTIDGAIARPENQETALQDKLRSCRRDWELLLKDKLTARAWTTAASAGNITAAMELRKKMFEEERTKVIVNLVKKERSVLPRIVHETLKPTLE